MNTIPFNGHAQRLLAAVRGVRACHVTAALASMLCLCQLPLRSRIRWSGCSKGTMARTYGAALELQGSDPDPVHGAHLRRLDLATLTRRARARAEGQAGWGRIDAQGASVATAPAPATVEIAAEVFKAPVLIALRQEVDDVSRSLLRIEDRLRAAEQRLKAAQEHNAALLALVSQAAVPGGIGGHEFTRPGGWLERAQQVLAVQVGACGGQGA